MKNCKFLKAILMVSCVLIGGCSLRFAPASSTNSIGGSCHSQIVERMYFGMNTPDGVVSERSWKTFLNEEITSRFPEGLTIFDSQGQWRGNSGNIERENSKVVEIVHDDSEINSKSVADIAKAYKDKFQQEAVLVLREFVYGCLQ